MAKILITGGAGYIGSHTALELLNQGYEVVVYDNLCNSSKESLHRVEELTGKSIRFYEGDVLDAEALEAMFRDYSYHPPENDPYHIERVRADEQLNRVFLYSYDWTKRTIRQFREQFGVFSEAVIFDWGPYDNYAIE